MASSKRFGFILMATTACAALAGCSGADGVASPRAGSINVTVPAPAPTPTPTPAATPSAITAAQFASTADQVTSSGAGYAITSDEQLAIVNAGTNNNVNGIGSVLNGMYPVGAASVTTATDPSTINSFFTSTNYVGALNGPSDTSFQGWTCNAPGIDFGGNGTSCSSTSALANYIGTAAEASAATCPAGTIDDGLVQSRKACRIPTTISSDLTLPRIAGVFYRLRGS